MNKRIEWIKLLLVMSVVFGLMTGCAEIDTDNPKKAYSYWTGTKTPLDITLLQAQYWQSPHWTKEYILYLKLKPTKEWWQEFINTNRLSLDTTQWHIPSDAPEWFKPSDNSIKYSGPGEYFKDTLTGTCFIYEMRL